MIERKYKQRQINIYASIDDNGNYVYPSKAVVYFKKIAIIRSAVFNWCLKNLDIVNPEHVILNGGMTMEEQFQAFLEDKPVKLPVFQKYYEIEDILRKFCHRYDKLLLQQCGMTDLGIIYSDATEYEGFYKLNILREIKQFRKYYEERKQKRLFDILNHKYNNIFMHRDHISFAHNCDNYHKEYYDGYDAYTSLFGLVYFETKEYDFSSEDCYDYRMIFKDNKFSISFKQSLSGSVKDDSHEFHGVIV